MPALNTPSSRGWLALTALTVVVLLNVGEFDVFTATPAPKAVAPPADTWTSPPVLQNTSAKPGVVELTLTASPTRLELVPGKPTEAWAYNGTVPGPTIELREGDLVTVHFTQQAGAADDGALARPPPAGKSRRQPAASRAAWQEPRLRLPHSSRLRGHVTGTTRIPT